MARTVDQLSVTGKKVLIRVDFNVPQDANGSITDDRRIKAALPTIKSVLDRGGRAILMSHLGRPEGKPEDAAKLTLAPIARRVGELLGQDVPLAPGCTGAAVKKLADGLKDGQAMLLENLRLTGSVVETTKKDKKTGEVKTAKVWTSFEEQGDPQLSKGLAELGELYVNDAFGTAHRPHCSMVGVPEILGPGKVAAGLLLMKEIEYLSNKLASPAKPFVCIMGGAKVSDKIKLITNLLNKVDTLLIGGAMSYTFMKANGKEIGDSKVEADKLDLALEIQKKAAEAKVRFELPVDFVAGKQFDANTETRVVEGEIPAGWQGLDIGPKTRAKYAEILAGARTIVWNGPVGVFEFAAFAGGTNALAKAVADATAKGAISIIGGGDSASAIEQAGLDDKMTHISTGGGASLELLEGKKFRSLEVLG